MNELTVEQQNIYVTDYVTQGYHVISQTDMGVTLQKLGNNNTNFGCVLLLLGLIFSPVLIGIPVILVGVLMMMGGKSTDTKQILWGEIQQKLEHEKALKDWSVAKAKIRKQRNKELGQELLRILHMEEWSRLELSILAGIISISVSSLVVFIGALLLV